MTTVVNKHLVCGETCIAVLNAQTKKSATFELLMENLFLLFFCYAAVSIFSSPSLQQSRFSLKHFQKHSRLNEEVTKHHKYAHA